jgi:hypothetical protein
VLLALCLSCPNARLRIHFSRLLNALVVLPREQEAHREEEADGIRERVELSSFRQFIQSFLLLAHCDQEIAAPLVSRCGAGIEFYPSFEFRCGTREIVFVV